MNRNCFFAVKMVVKPEQQQMQMLLTEAITVLCKNGLQYRSHFNVEGLLGITLDDEDVFLVSIKQTVKGAETGDSSTNVHLDKQGSVKKEPLVETSPMSRAKQRKRRKRSTDSIERVTPTNIPLNNNNPEKKNSNVPYDYKPQQEDNFDDNASSPGELIVVKEENLTDIERTHYSMKEENITDMERAPIENQYNQKEKRALPHYSRKEKSPHSRNTATTATNAQQQQQQESKNGGSSNGAIYASSNGQINVDAPRSSPYNGQIDGTRNSPYQQAWESPYTTTSDAQNDSGTDDRSFAQQVCSTQVPHF